eukprot:EG_transcript_2265
MPVDDDDGLRLLLPKGAMSPKCQPRKKDVAARGDCLTIHSSTVAEQLEHVRFSFLEAKCVAPPDRIDLVLPSGVEHGPSIYGPPTTLAQAENRDSNSQPQTPHRLPLLDPCIEREDPSGRFVCSGRLLNRNPREVVYRARDEEEGVDVAWTELTFNGSRQEMVKRFNEEMNILECLYHENVLEYLTHFQLGDTFVFITESMPGDTLKAFIQKCKSRCLRLKVTQRICTQLLRALEYLHSLDPPIAHGNVHCDSVYIDSRTGDVRLGNFRLCSDDVRSGQRLEYAAPETLADGYVCAPAGDVWSFGMCVLEMVTGQEPYAECQGDEALIRQHIVSGKLPEALDRVPQDSHQVFNQQTQTVTDIREFILACLQPQSLRPTVAVVGLHPFLAATVQMDSPRRRQAEEDRPALSIVPSWSSSPGASPLVSRDSSTSRRPTNPWPTHAPPSPIENGAMFARAASFDSEENGTLSMGSYLSACSALRCTSADYVEMQTPDPQHPNHFPCTEDHPVLLTMGAITWDPARSAVSSGATTRSNGHFRSQSPPHTNLWPLCCESGHGLAIQRLLAEELRLQDSLHQLEREYLSNRQRRQEQMRRLEVELSSLQGGSLKPPAVGSHGGRRKSNFDLPPGAACPLPRGSLSFSRVPSGAVTPEAGLQRTAVPSGGPTTRWKGA